MKIQIKRKGNYVHKCNIYTLQVGKVSTECLDNMQMTKTRQN